ncbi:MAG TPA: hypothetical protein VLZ75_02735 [Chitinophagales bacterium]|nr:hypothetical protein [Chitinophagales bacterium]
MDQDSKNNENEWILSDGYRAMMDEILEKDLQQKLIYISEENFHKKTARK